MKNFNYELVQEVENFDYSNEQLYDDLYQLTNEDNIIKLAKEFEHLKKNNIDINRVNNDGQTALMLAIKHGNTIMIELLLQENADIDFQDKEGNTALIMASQNKLSDVVEKLLKYGADPRIQNFVGQNALYFSIANMHPDIISLLEDHGTGIEGIAPLNVTVLEEEKAKEIVSIISNELNDKNSIINFLIYALDCNYVYELNLDYYIRNNPNFLVSFKPGRDQQFQEVIVQLYKKMHKKYLNPLNINDESKNNIRNKIYDLLMQKHQLGKYVNSSFEEIEGEEHLYTIKILSDEISGNIDVFDNHITLKILNNDSKITSFEYAQQSDGSYINKDRGEIIISKKSIIEKNRSGGQRVSEYIKIDNDILDTNKSNHNPQALSDKLKKFSSDKRLRYTNHPWTDTTFENFYTDLNKGWDEIKNDIEILSPSLFESIDKFLFATNNTDTVGFSSDAIKEQLESGNKKPDLIKNLNESINTFKQSILVKNDENQKLIDLFERVLDKSQLDLDINLEGIEDFTGRFYTDMRKLEVAIGLILKDINKIDSDAEIKVIADSNKDPITLKIIHKGSTYNNDSKILLKTIGTTGNFTSIYDVLKSVCHWDVEAKCADGVKTIHYLYPQRDGVTPYADPKGTAVEGFTHILRFYK